MNLAILGEEEVLPETFHFLNAGWWVVHLIAVLVVAYIGYLIGGKQKAGGSARG